jgi:hypothetical protein
MAALITAAIRQRGDRQGRDLTALPFLEFFTLGIRNPNTRVPGFAPKAPKRYPRH